MPHASKIRRVAEEMRSNFHSSSPQKIRPARNSSNSTKPSGQKEYMRVDVSDFNEVLEINTTKQYVVCEANISMEKLVAETLRYGLVPAVVPEFRAITVGGAVQGAALESGSFRYGQFNDLCEEYEIVTGSGEVVKATSYQNSDLFYGVSGAYGSLGVLTTVKIKLVPAKKYVSLTYVPTESKDETVEVLKKYAYDGKADFLDAIVFSEKHGVVMVGNMEEKSTSSVQTFSKATDPWFYLHAKKIKTKRTESIPVDEYLFRYDRGAFWMGEMFFKTLHFPTGNNAVTRFLCNPVLSTKKLYEAMHNMNLSGRVFVQDMYCPVENIHDLLGCVENELDIYPLWLCPMNPASTQQKLSPHYLNTDLIINVGIWGQTQKFLSSPLQKNRNMEQCLHQKCNGRKMLYAQSFYPEDVFWSIYDREWYENLRKRYDAGVFPSVFEKTVIRELPQPTFWSGFFKMILSNFKW